MRSKTMRISGLAVAAWIAGSAAVADALTLASNAIELETPDGAISLLSQVEDNVGGDHSRWLFSYLLAGSYEPLPGQSNGLSSFWLFFGGPVPDVTDASAPAGWLVACCGLEPPFGLSFDLPNSAGQGAGPNGGLGFSFAVPAGTPFTDESQASFVASHVADVPFGGVVAEEAIVRGATVLLRGPIVPVPEPGSLALVAGGLALLARRRVSSAA